MPPVKRSVRHLSMPSSTNIDRAGKLHARLPVVLVGAGDVAKHDLQRFPHDWIFVGVDGGANTCKNHGRSPSLVLGDLDSYEPDPLITAPVKHIPEQNSTDLQKALMLVDAPLIIGLGFLSDRLDHALAALDTLAYCQRPFILIGEQDAVVTLPQHTDLTLPVGTRLSLMPWPEKTLLHDQGLEYPLKGLTLKQGIQLGTSNKTIAEAVHMVTEPDGLCLLILPKTELNALIHLFAPQFAALLNLPNQPMP